MFCTECGKPVKSDYKFCPHCGARRDEELIGEEARTPGSVAKAEQAPLKARPEPSVYVSEPEYDEPACHEPEPEYDEPVYHEPEPEYGEPAYHEPEQRHEKAAPLEQGYTAASPRSWQEGGLVPPPTFTYEEEEEDQPEEDADDHYYVYHSEQELREQAAAEKRSVPPRAAAAQPDSGPGLPIKLLVIFLVILFALTLSVVFYQLLVAEEPFAAGWLFGLGG